MLDRHQTEAYIDVELNFSTESFVKVKQASEILGMSVEQFIMLAATEKLEDLSSTKT